MENFSQETEEAQINQPTSEIQEINDIGFEEVLDLDEIQKKVQETIEQNGFLGDEMYKSEENFSTLEAKLEKDLSIIYANAKKYIIYIDKENVDFIESLSINERREIINKKLKEYKEQSIANRKAATRNKRLRHIAFSFFTFIIFFPMVLICINKTLQISVTNYSQAKGNFAKLYKEHGKIQMKDTNATSDVKY